MRLWFMAIKEKDIHKLKKVFKGFKDQGSPLASHQLFSLVILVEETTSKYVNYLNVIFINQPML